MTTSNPRKRVLKEDEYQVVGQVFLEVECKDPRVGPRPTSFKSNTFYIVRVVIPHSLWDVMPLEAGGS